MRPGTFFGLLFMCAVAALLFAALFGVLPEPIQTELAQFSEAFAPRAASEPYMQKFEGRWHVVFGDGRSTDVADCTGGSLDVRVHDGSFKGSLAVPGSGVRAISAQISPDGSLAGTIDAGVQRHGALSGTIDGPDGKGEWHDEENCSGSLTLTKTDPVVDPTVGFMANYSGSVTLTRGGQELSLYPHYALYPGDRIMVSEGQATVSIGLYPPKVVELSPGDTYTVPNL